MEERKINDVRYCHKMRYMIGKYSRKKEVGSEINTKIKAKMKNASQNFKKLQK